MGHLFRKVFTLWCLICLAAANIQAQSPSTELKGVFERVISPAGIHSGDLCLIAGTIVPFGESSEAARRPYLLTANADDGKWLEAEMIETDVEKGTAITAAERTQIWQATLANGTITLKSQATDLWLSPGKSSMGATSLIAAATEPYVWNLTTATEGRFYLKNKDNSRWLTLYREQTPHFGCYSNVTPADCHTLIIYKYVANGVDQDVATLPEDNSDVVLAGGMWLTGTSLNTVIATETLLSDGTTAQTDALKPWRLCHRPDSCFVLQKADGTCLDYTLQHSAGETTWRISQGKIFTVEAMPRSLSFSSSGQLILSEETSDNATATFVTASSPAQASTDSDGITTLTGGWAATALEQIDWSATTTLNLTSISLPVRSFSFVNRPTDRHTFILVSETDAADIPQSWPFVVADTKEGYNLITSSVIQDRQTFAPTVDIRYKAGQVTYCREAYADGGWETLCLPFATYIPDTFRAQALQEAQADTLIFSPLQDVPAHTPVIIRYGNPFEGNIPLTLTATQDGTFKA
ncbi:MAG: hypothetical protein ACI4V2_00240, partial [Alloprevotella sp.]